MKQYTVKIDDTVAEFLEYVARSQNMLIEEVVEDVVFNQVSEISEKIAALFMVKEADL